VRDGQYEIARIVMLPFQSRDEFGYQSICWEAITSWLLLSL
jgi:hypothetical protein